MTRSAYSTWDESEIRRQLPSGELTDQIVLLVNELHTVRGEVTPQMQAAAEIAESIRKDYQVDLLPRQWNEIERMIADRITALTEDK